MAAKVRYIPEGYHNLTPYLICQDAAKAIDYYKQAFGATELLRMGGAEGKIGHAELKIGDSHLMLADEHAGMGAHSATHYGGSPVSILIYVEDVDRVFEKAVSLGASVKRAPQDMFYGDRTCWVVDPFGHSWYLHTHIKDVTPEEIKQAMAGSGQ